MQKIRRANMDPINPINTAAPSAAKTDAADKQTEKMKQLVKDNKFESFDVDNDGKLSGIELTRLKMCFSAVDFDTDDDGAVDEASFNDALSEYQE